MNNKIQLVIFSSSLHPKTSVMGTRKELFEGIRRFAELDIVYPSMLVAGRTALEGLFDGGRGCGSSLPDDAAAKTVCFIATGGTEEIFKDFVAILPRPVLLLSDGLHNSFAASFEIKTWLAQQGIPSLLFNAPLDYSPAFFEDLEKELFGNAVQQQ